jgi:hypothetical protein
MPTKTPNEICAEVLTTLLIKIFALNFGQTNDSIRGWKYPLQRGGKRSPIDNLAKFLKLLHGYDPGGARQVLNYFIELVGELDAAAGYKEIETTGSILNCLRSKTKEGADVLLLLMTGDFNLKTLNTARKELSEERAALEQLDAAIASVINQRKPTSIQKRA